MSNGGTNPVRSPAYPNTPLAEAVAAVRKIEAQYRNAPVDRVDGAKILGYSGLSGPANQALSSLAHYGLVERAGKGHMRVTERARAILHPVSESEKWENLRQAAMEPDLFRELQERFPNMTPPEDGVVTYLNRQGFNQTAIRPAAKAFLQTMAFLEETGASESHGKGDGDGAESASSQGDGRAIIYGGARVGDLVDFEVDGFVRNVVPYHVVGISDDQAWVFTKESQVGLPMSHVIVKERGAPEPLITPPFANPPANPFLAKEVEKNEALPETQPTAEGFRSEKFDADEGVITISWPSNLSPQSVEDMQSWVELLMKRIARRANAN